MECASGNEHFGTGTPDNNENSDAFLRIRLAAPAGLSQSWQPWIIWDPWARKRWDHRVGPLLNWFLLFPLAAMAGVFAATDSAVANVRETKDAWNSVAAGCASGIVAGGFQRNAQTMVFGCLGMGAMMGAFDFSGNSLKVKRRIRSLMVVLG